jgi:DNA polymerase III delta subunit
MLYIFYGTDRDKILKESEKLVSDISKKESVITRKIDADNYVESETRDVAGATSLFGEKSVVILDGVISKDEENLSILELLQESENFFILREGKLTKEVAKKFPKKAEIEEFIEKTAQKKEFFNPFSLTDAIASRDKKNAWILYEKALAGGQVADEIFWRVTWQVKALLLADKTKSATEADLKPFVYTKAKSALKNWKEGELEQLSEKLVSGYQLARRGEGEIETLLEKILLSF